VYTAVAGISSSKPAGPAGYAIAYLGGAGTEFDVSGRTSTTIRHTGNGLDVVQVAAVEGSDLPDSRVRVTTTARNLDSKTHLAGVRYKWDLMIADNDDAWFAAQDLTRHTHKRNAPLHHLTSRGSRPPMTP